MSAAASRRVRRDGCAGLRLAWSLDESELAADPVLGELAWAETIVRVEIRVPGFIERVRSEICTFPSEFLLFLPAPVTLLLDDGAHPFRELRVEIDGSERLLFAGQEQYRCAKSFARSPLPMSVHAPTQRSFTHGTRCRWPGQFHWKASARKPDAFGHSSRRTLRVICPEF